MIKFRSSEKEGFWEYEKSNGEIKVFPKQYSVDTTSADHIAIKSINGGNLFESLKFDEIEIEGTVPVNGVDAQNKLAVILFKKGGGGASGGDLTEDKANTLYRRIDKNITLREGQKLIGKVGEKEYKIAETKKLDDGSGDYMDIGSKDIPMVLISSERPTTDIAGVKHQNAFLEDVMDIVTNNLVGSEIIEINQDATTKKINLSLKGERTAPANRTTINYANSRKLIASNQAEVTMSGINIDKIKAGVDDVKMWLYKADNTGDNIFATSWTVNTSNYSITAYFDLEGVESGSYLLAISGEKAYGIVDVTMYNNPTELDLSAETWELQVNPSTATATLNDCTTSGSSILLKSNLDTVKSSEIEDTWIGFYSKELESTQNYDVHLTIGGMPQMYNTDKTWLVRAGLTNSTDKTISNITMVGIEPTTILGRAGTLRANATSSVKMCAESYEGECNVIISKRGNQFTVTSSYDDYKTTLIGTLEMTGNALIRVGLRQNRASLQVVQMPSISVVVDKIVMY